MNLRTGLILVIALVLASVGALFDPVGASVVGAAARPDIVVFYLDDVQPGPARLWENRALTPNLARFAKDGIAFENAIASSPMCSPARGNLLTGRYSHQHGIDHNNARAYRPAGTVAPLLRSTGYRTVFIGKHLNGLRKTYPNARAMQKVAVGWNRFDAIWENGGRYYDYRQYRKGQQPKRFGNRGTDHSTYQAVKRAVKHISETPPNRPLFLLLSLHDGHEPLTALPRFRGDRRCRQLVDYRGPAYNEADVSDKPRHVRRKPLLKSPTFDLRTRCEQQLTIDWAAGEVNAALRRNGRLSNALEVITSDHGYLLGDHRIVGKAESYAAPVPLYMRWPAMTGKGGRTVDEPVSNVDLAPTFCALAGCSMPDAEGHSLVPIIRGDASRLERDYLYTELLNGAGCYRSPRYPRPEWSGVETTLRYSPTRWAYTLYRDGQEELYDLTHDPHRLVNVAHGGDHADVLADVRAFREEVWQHNQRGWCRE